MTHASGPSITLTLLVDTDTALLDGRSAAYWPARWRRSNVQHTLRTVAMFDPRQLRHAFLLFHLVLGAALLWGSVHTVLHLGPSDPHALLIGTIEAVAAAAFLMPRTMRIGAGVLLAVLALAFVIHATRGEWRPDLLVYAAGVLLVSVHGDVRPSDSPAAGVA
jgi:hypothetical protein